jgi:hypothetical protein
MLGRELVAYLAKCEAFLAMTPKQRARALKLAR